MNLLKYISVPVVALLLTSVGSCSGHGPGNSKNTGTSTSTPSAPVIGTPTQQNPAHGLTFSAPSSIVSDKQPTKDKNGKSRINYYITNEDSPIFVDIEYYTNNSQTASSILERDKIDYAADGAPISPRETTVNGSSNAYTFSWEQSAPPPWNDKTTEIDLSCRAILADGPSGYSYGIYACSPKGNDRSAEIIQNILESITVGQS